MITLPQFKLFIDVRSYKVKNADLYAAIVSGMEQCEATTDLRIAMWLAQTAHETGGYNYFTEFGKDSYFERYEGRKDLGNTEEGDGPRFRGRGFIQITGRANYQKASDDLGVDLMTDPTVAAGLDMGALVAAWYWSSRKLNPPSDAGNILRVTKLINGGYNGLEDRITRYEKAKRALGI